MLNKNTVLSALLAAGIGTMGLSSALAAVSAEEAKQLGATLTEFGAEKAGNADGSIPAYTGGLANVPGYDAKTMPHFIDPYKSDKLLYSVNAQNMAQYDALLTPSNKIFMKRFPGYRLDVYPSHRSVRYPAWVLPNIVKNATTAKLGGPVEGDDLMGADAGGKAYPGIPFPIPKTGYEVMWNHFLHVAPPLSHRISRGWLTDSGGSVSLISQIDEWLFHPAYDKSGALGKAIGFDSTFGFNVVLQDPPSSAGIVFLNYYTYKGSEGGQKVWFYTPGQRRVRMAPEFAYDVPIASYGGVSLWDEVFGFVGRMDRFDFKLVGKKEMLVPYNVFGVSQTMLIKDSLGKQSVNPEAVRYEKHRVWVVDAIRKPGARHVYSRRTYYVDEDSWNILYSEHYDNAGNMYRVTQHYSYPAYSTFGINAENWSTYDLIKGNYFIVNAGHAEPGYIAYDYESIEGHPVAYTAQAVAGSGVR